MKKTIILASALFIFLGTTKAQDVHFGIKGGLNASNINVKNSLGNNQDTKIGWYAGLLAHIHAGKSFAIQPEVYYSDEGSKLTSGSNKSTLNLGYINVPVLAQYMFGNGFRIEAGPQVGFLINAKDKDKSSSLNLDVKDTYKSTSFSIPVGVGYLTSYGLGFDARYNFGISDIQKVTIGDNKARSNVFQFGLFYQFPERKVTTTKK
ncbi:MAG: porin family protein [Chitinophagaceae bacterium]